MCMCPTRLFGFRAMCGSVPLAGECGITNAFAGVFKLLTMLCGVCVCACLTRPFGPWAFLAPRA